MAVWTVIDSVEPKKVEHVNTERVAVGDFTDLKAKTEFSSG